MKVAADQAENNDFVFIKRYTYRDKIIKSYKKKVAFYDSAEMQYLGCALLVRGWMISLFRILIFICILEAVLLGKLYNIYGGRIFLSFSILLTSSSLSPSHSLIQIETISTKTLSQDPAILGVYCQIILVLNGFPMSL